MLRASTTELRRLRVTRGAYRRTARRAARALAALAVAGSLLAVPLGGTAAAAPSFAAPVENPFGFSQLVGPLFWNQPAPAVADIDGDGDLDVLLGGANTGDATFHQNLAAAGGTTPSFAGPLTNPFGLTNVGADSSPTFVDIDGDGDLDAFVGVYAGDTYFFENTAITAGGTTPVFDAPVTNPFSLASVRSNELPQGLRDAGAGDPGSHEPCFADLDGDGDLDAVAGGIDVDSTITKYGEVIFFENTEASGGSTPTFAGAVTNPFGLQNVGANASPSLADIDQDGDIDAFFGNASGDLVFFENTAVTGGGTTPIFTTLPVANPFGLANVGFESSPSFADIDGDGDQDAFIGGASTAAAEYTDTTFFENVTVPPVLDHFTCYKTVATKGSTKFPGIPNPPGVTLEDRFASSTVAVKKPTRLCAPTQKNSEPPPLNPSEHLRAYQVKPAEKFTKVLGEVVTDQFGTHHVDVLKPAELLVPTAKDLLVAPAPPVSPVTDHLQCYKVKDLKIPAKFAPVTVAAQDQFGSLSLEVKKPTRLCAPVDKNGEDATAPGHPGHLMCYQVKDLKAPQFALVSPAFVNNQLGPETVDVKKPAELCVPALKAP